MADATLDLSKTLGISTESGGKLLGYFTQIVGHSTESAVQLLKAAESLAVAEGVAPAAVMKDVSENTETFAKFGKDGGRNLLEASIQARKLGTDLGTVATIAEGLLDFQTSLNKEVEAEMLLGKDLNLQKARELALNNDLAGMMEEVTSQLGSQAEFEKMNFFQRQALADALNVSVSQMEEFVANQDKSVTLADKLAKQEGFEQLVGEDALSSLAEITNSLKTIGAVLTQTFAPAIEMVLTPFAKLMSWVAESPAMLGALKGAAMVLIPVMGALATATVISAIANLWNAVMKMAGLTAGFGTAAAVVAGLAGTAAIIGAVTSARSATQVGDIVSPARGRTMVSTKEGGLFQLSPRDDLMAGPGLAGGGGVGADEGLKEQLKQNSRDIRDLTAIMATSFGPTGLLAMAKLIGREVGKSTGSELKTMNM